MTLDWAHFTLFSALIGGLIIGLAAALLILLNGRIAGISGILGGLLTSAATDNCVANRFCSRHDSRAAGLVLDCR